MKSTAGPDRHVPVGTDGEATADSAVPPARRPRLLNLAWVRAGTRAAPVPEPVPGRRLLAAIGIWIAAAGAIGVATYFGARAIAPTWATAINLGAVISAEVYLALAVVLSLVIGKPLGWRTPDRQDVILGAAAAITVWAATAAIYLALWPVLGSLEGLFEVLTFLGSDGGRVGSVGSVLLVLSLTRAVVITPVAEELLFRGALHGWLRRWWPAWATTLVSAAVFAAYHGFPVLMPYVLTFGIVTGWLRERTGSIAAGLVSHVLNSMMLLLIGTSLLAPVATVS